MEKEILKSDGLLPRKRDEIRVITRYKKIWPVDLMCRLSASPAMAIGSYCKRRNTTQPDPEHQEMLEAVKEIAKASDNSYGTRRMKRALNALGYPVSRQKARKLMRGWYYRSTPQEIQGDHEQQSPAAAL